MLTATQSIGFTQEAFEEFLARRDEPAWLTDMRKTAWKHFCELPLPSTHDEEWMRTDIRLLKLDRYGLPTARPMADLPDLPHALLAEGVELGGRAASFDGQPAGGGLADSLSSQGVLFGSLEKLVQTHGDVLRPAFQRQIVDPATDKFSALQAACWSGGVVLYVPKNVRVTQPLHHLASMGDGTSDLSRTLVVLEEGAEATLLSETASFEENSGGFHCGAIELIVGPEAKLRYVNLQNWGDGVWHFAHQRADVARNGAIQWTIGALGSRLAKVNQSVVLSGQDAEAQVNGVMFTQGKQHLSYATHQYHRAPYCRSDLLYKAALQDKSRTVWRGMIKVDPGAQRTDAYQRNDNLMLTTTARADSIPGLEIEADDVRCTHGSTSGRVDDNQVYYAMTRGYTRTEAIRMIVEGFFQQVFDRITIESVREALGEAIGQRVRDI